MSLCRSQASQNFLNAGPRSTSSSRKYGRSLGKTIRVRARLLLLRISIEAAFAVTVLVAWNTATAFRSDARPCRSRSHWWMTKHVTSAILELRTLRRWFQYSEDYVVNAGWRRSAGFSKSSQGMHQRDAHVLGHELVCSPGEIFKASHIRSKACGRSLGCDDFRH